MCCNRPERWRNQCAANLLNLKQKRLIVWFRTQAESSKSVHAGEPRLLRVEDKCPEGSLSPQVIDFLVRVHAGAYGRVRLDSKRMPVVREHLHNPRAKPIVPEIDQDFAQG
jgi:hypothetical protein